MTDAENSIFFDWVDDFCCYLFKELPKDDSSLFTHELLLDEFKVHIYSNLREINFAIALLVDNPSVY